jgi:hypothetical protein
MDIVGTVDSAYKARDGAMVRIAPAWTTAGSAIALKSGVPVMFGGIEASADARPPVPDAQR